MELKSLGYRHGVFDLIGSPPYNMHREELGGSVRVNLQTESDPRQQNQGIIDCTESGPRLHRGNVFERFTHSRDHQGDWYYFDNPLLPQFSGPSLACVRSQKWYHRMVRRSLCPGRIDYTEQELQSHEDRINQNLRYTGQATEWSQCFNFHHTEPRGRTVLFCVPSATCVYHWYGQKLETLTERLRLICQSQGLELRIREKPQVKRGPWQFRYENFSDVYCVITIHSALGIEALEYGLPVVALGYHALHDLSTPWWEFRRGHLRLWEAWAVEHRVRQLLALTWYRSDWVEGLWSLDTHSYQPQRFIGLPEELCDGV